MKGNAFSSASMSTIIPLEGSFHARTCSCGRCGWDSWLGDRDSGKSQNRIASSLTRLGVALMWTWVRSSCGVLAIMFLPACLKSPSIRLVPVEQEPSIVFPQFSSQTVIEVGAHGGVYELDGEVLRAIMIAANDFLPPDYKNPTCQNNKKAHRYRVIREGDVIFVDVYEDYSYCDSPYAVADFGAQYAISATGRILRRDIDGFGPPLDSSGTSESDGGLVGEVAEVGTTSAYDGSVPDELVAIFKKRWERSFRFRDGGVAPGPEDGGERPDGGKLEGPERPSSLPSGVSDAGSDAGWEG